MGPSLPDRDRASVHRWMAIFVFSFAIAAALLRPSLQRFGDGDDAHLFYDSGLRSWGEVFRLTVLPPGQTQVVETPEMGSSGPIPAKPVFVFGHWRPFSQFAYVKALWTLGLSPHAYKILSWLSCWLAALGLAWGVCSAFSLALEVPPETIWVLATALFWSVPTLYPSTITFFTVNIATLLFGLATGLLCRCGRARAPRVWEIAAAAILGFLACQSHENTWWLLIWLSVYLGVLRYFGQLKTGPRFWWPAILLAVYVLAYRSLSPEPSPDWAAGTVANYSFAPAVVWSRFSYFILAPLNGLSVPLVSLMGADLTPLDVEPAGFPLAFLLTGFSVIWILTLSFSSESKQSKDQAWVSWVFGLTLAIGALSILPYCVVRNLRFIYYSKLLADLFVIAMIFLWLRLKRPRGTLLVPWIVAGMLTTGLMAHHPSWLNRNSDESQKFTEELIQARPELKACSPKHPCCISGYERSWGRNEWVLSYNLGAASKLPAFYPEQWPGAHCERHIKLN